MAGQSPEPSFQPNGQDQGLTQGRQAWAQPPAYTPPAGSTGGQAYAAAPPPPYAQQAQQAPQTPQEPYGAAPQAPQAPQEQQSYPAQDQTITSLSSQDYQSYQAYQQAYQGYGAPPSQPVPAPPGQSVPAPPPQWQASAQPAAAQPAAQRTRTRGDKGLIGSLFDFSFTSMVTPKIIKTLYILFTIWTVLAALGILGFFINFGGLQGALAVIIIIDPVFILLSLGVYRIILEAFMVIFQIHGELKAIREQGAKHD
jgi:Domain of unknown function (DUF4282)